MCDSNIVTLTGQRPVVTGGLLVKCYIDSGIEWTRIVPKTMRVVGGGKRNTETSGEKQTDSRMRDWYVWVTVNN